MKSYSKKESSINQEKHVAKVLNGQVQIASGGLSHNAGDVIKNNWFFECKTVTSEKNSYSIKKSVINKAREQCFEQMKDYWSLVFRFAPNDKDYYVVDEDTFKYMMECTNYCDMNEVNINE